MEAGLDAPRILVVEDDARLGRLLVEYLASHGYHVDLEPRGDTAVARILADQPAVLVLDLMLPGIDGFEVYRRVRSGFRGRVLMLTARRADADHVAGLELGADDYVTKPVDPRVLLARVQVLLRRAPAEPDPARLVHGTLTLDRTLREVTIRGTPLALTGVEFDLLWLLASHAGGVVGRERLHRDVRGVPYDGLDRSVDIHVSRLRRKLKDAGLDGDVKALRGVGYQLAVRT